MSHERSELDGWVLTDQEGNYFLLSRETLERTLVPEEQRDQIEQRLRPADVSGFQVTIERRPPPIAGLTLLGELVSGLIPEASHAPSDGPISNITDGTSNTRR